VKTRILHVLNPRLKVETVVKYLKCLYLNSDECRGFNRLGHLSNKYWQGRVIIEGPRIALGDNPCLMAWHVRDLTIEVDYEQSREIFRWTQVPGSRYNAETNVIEKLGEALKR
jgi:hypothetical protein